MTISNIGSIYTKLLNNLKEKNAAATASSSDKTKATDSTGAVTNTKDNTGTKTSTGSSLTDKLDLTSDEIDPEQYLNYGQMAKYNMPTLSDFMAGTDDGSDTSDPFGMDLSGVLDSGTSLGSIMNQADSESSSNSGMFDALIQSTTTYNNRMINQAVKKYTAANGTSSDSIEKELEAIKAEIKAAAAKTGKTTNLTTEIK